MYMIATVYVDGFNLYYRALRGKPYKWLDLQKLFALLLPEHDVKAIKYFTAIVKPTEDNPGVADRQLTYIRALQTIDNIQIIRGQFLKHKVWLPLAEPQEGENKRARVLKWEEKGSDVNLASHLLLDSFNNAYETAAVVTNDSDLVTPIRMVRDQLNKPVILLSPSPQAGNELRTASTEVRYIRDDLLAISQFPIELQDANGRFHKPPSW